MKTWLKGGLIGGAILLILDVILLIWMINYRCVGMGCIGRGIWIYALWIALIPLFIVGFILGVISVIAFKSQRKIITKSSKIGFIIGLVISILIWSTTLFHLSRELPFNLILIATPFVSAWIVWVIWGLIIQKLKR